MRAGLRIAAVVMIVVIAACLVLHLRANQRAGFESGFGMAGSGQSTIGTEHSKKTPAKKLLKTSTYDAVGGKWGPEALKACGADTAWMWLPKIHSSDRGAVIAEMKRSPFASSVDANVDDSSYVNSYNDEKRCDEFAVKAAETGWTGSCGKCAQWGNVHMIHGPGRRKNCNKPGVRSSCSQQIN